MARKRAASQGYSVTSAGVNPTEDRAHRMRMYFTAMVLRVVCVTSLFWVQGWWVVVPVLGAIFLPWFAVMVGNAVAYGGGEKVEALAPLQIVGAESDESGAASGEAATLLVFDVDPVRRKADLGDTTDTPSAEHQSEADKAHASQQHPQTNEAPE